MKFKRNGYTLAELMIVLLIVGVIAAILFPVVARMRENSGGKNYACHSNLKQIGLGFMQYAQDNDDALPIIALNAVPVSLPPYSTALWLGRCVAAICEKHRDFSMSRR